MKARRVGAGVVGALIVAYYGLAFLGAVGNRSWLLVGFLCLPLVYLAFGRRLATTVRPPCRPTATRGGDMDAKYVALGLFGLVSFQAGADPQGTQEGVGSFFTATNGVVKQAPLLFNADRTGSSPTPAPDKPGSRPVTLSDGRQVSIAADYRLVPTGT